MSARRSLYGQSLLGNGQSTNFGSIEPQERYFSLTKIQLEKITEDDKSNKATVDDSEENDTKYNFYVKTWTPTSEPSTKADSDESDFLNIHRLLEAKEEEKKKHVIMNNGSGLSAADIRGAVGVEEGISGLSSSTDNATASKKQKDAKESEEKAESNNTADAENPVEAANADIVMGEAKDDLEKPANVQTSEGNVEASKSPEISNELASELSTEPLKISEQAETDIEMKDANLQVEKPAENGNDTTV